MGSDAIDLCWVTSNILFLDKLEQYESVASGKNQWGCIILMCTFEQLCCIPTKALEL